MEGTRERALAAQLATRSGEKDNCEGYMREGGGGARLQLRREAGS